ncbi:hypothetical protein GOBAR_AA36736 [Gossypium barbadense]|uniref:DNA mismatch repair proteins mutS family domain-containing protein n=3 Tax=Gossypium TaxID=3633 RepID=A0A2P5VYR9_GOSBA|nr:hypothetical protein GOBAR_AA36736 [Gossypium barbadense]
MEDDGGERSSFVIGLIENRAKEVGMAAFDLRSASLHLSQYIETSISYQNTKTLLHFYDPMVIIVPPNKLAPEGMVGVSELVDRFYASVKKFVMARGCFDDTKGAMLIKNLATREPSALGLDTYYKQYYLCLASASAAIKWCHLLFMGDVYVSIISSLRGKSLRFKTGVPFIIELYALLSSLGSPFNLIIWSLPFFKFLISWIEAEKGVIITSHSLVVTFNGSFDHMNIDTTSVHNLEIVEPLHSARWGTSNKKRSLFHMLKTTKTIGGTRLLRANLLQPLKDIETINTRLDCLDELMSNEQLFFGLSQVLRKFPKETDRVLCHFCFKPKKITNEVLGADDAKKSQMLISSIILLKTALDALPLLSKVLKDAQCFILANVYKSVCENEKYADIRKRIGEVIDEDVLHARVPFIARTQQCFAVKAGIDGLLDIARRSFCDTSEAIHNLANKYREEYKLPNLKLPFNNRRGFYFSIPRKDIQGKLPSKFIQVVKQGNNVHCSTLELASLNVRNKSAAGECYVRTEVCLEALVDAIREDIPMFTLLAEVLCLLDMIVNSFAHTISTKPVDRYTRPGFTDNGPLAIDAGRHPILESIHSDFVFALALGGRLRSGKSTYLQQVCLIIILAQIGCYVPAHFATIRVVDRIFTRMGTMDNLESNSSTFMTEMKETAFIMQNVSQRSLIVMDELGRATSSSDGLAIAWSCCEYLLSLNAYTIFATHMENLSKLATIYPNVKILYFYVDIRNSRLDFKFRLNDGPKHVAHYGLLLAEVAGLPSSVIETARSITSRITEKEVNEMEVNCLNHNQIMMAYRAAQRLICLKYSNQKEEAIRQALHLLKENYIDVKL